MDNKRIGLFLQGLRKERNMTQLDLATELNVTHQTVSKWENGDSLPDISTLQTLAKFYNITIEGLLEGELKSSIVEVNEDAKPKMWILSRLVGSFILFITLVFNYVTESGKVGDTLPVNDFDPFGMSDISYSFSLKGFDLVFNATGLSLFTSGAWLIFISSLLLMIVLGMRTYSLYSNNTIIQEETSRNIKKWTQLVAVVGFALIFLGVIINSAVSANVGLILGLIIILGLYGVDYLEKRQ